MGLSLSAPLLSGVRRVPDANAQHRHRWLHTRVRTHTHTYTHSWPVWTLRVALIDLCGSVKVTRCMWLDESSDFGLPWGIAGTSLMGGFSFATLLSSFFFTYFTHKLPFPAPLPSLFGLIFFFSSCPQMQIVFIFLPPSLITHLLLLSLLIAGSEEKQRLRTH